MSQRPFLPNKNESKKFVLALGSVALALAVVHLISPPTTAPHGRWSLLTGPIYEHFGAYGLAGYYFAIGCILIGLSFGRD